MEKEDKILKNKNNKKTASVKFILLLLKLLIALFVYLVFFRLVFGITRMDSPSMSPTIKEGELLMVFRLEPKYDIGDTVIINNNNNKTQILRIVATEGQIVSISKDNTLLVDGVPEDHLVFYNTKASEKSNIKFPYEVENDKFFVLNDYRITDDDSREYGAIAKEDIKGKVIGKLQVRDI